MNVWTQFFREAGVPPSAADSYSGIFEDNRITRDMLLDLTKDILSDMGIKVMGDIIRILKHAQKEARKKECIGSDNSHASSAGRAPLAHSTTSGHPDAVSTTSTAGRKSNVFSSVSPTNNWNKAAVLSHGFVCDQGEFDLVTTEGLVKLTGLRSDQMESNTGHHLNQVPLEQASQVQHSQHQEEGYTTPAYERNLQKKRPATKYSNDSHDDISPNKHPRVVVLPGERGQELYTTTALQRAAAVMTATAIAPEMGQGERFPVSSSRKLSGDDGVTIQLRPSSPPLVSRLAVDPFQTKTVKLVRGSKREKLSEKQSKPKATTVPDMRMSSIIQTLSLPGRVSDRLTASERQQPSNTHSRTKKMAAHTLSPVTSSSTTGRVINRLGTRDTTITLGQEFESNSDSAGKVVKRLGKKSIVRIAGSNSTSSTRKVSTGTKKQTPAQRSMVADDHDYQTERQMDIRSRLDKKEKEKKARRSGPLGSRLGKHNVFQRLE